MVEQYSCCGWLAGWLVVKHFVWHLLYESCYKNKVIIVIIIIIMTGAGCGNQSQLQ